jgi:F-type H+-transporting ATPase subunit gamma
LGLLLPKYLEVALLQILLESKASELGARLRAMANATENAEKVVDDLKLQFYRARQDSITREILEVVSGAEALKG